jgi:hypothetical protein
MQRRSGRGRSAERKKQVPRRGGSARQRIWFGGKTRRKASGLEGLSDRAGRRLRDKTQDKGTSRKTRHYTRADEAE